MKKHKTKKTKSNQVSEERLLEAIDLITRKLSYKFKFGYHELEDMRQQISIFAIEGLEKYDHTRPLENFLWTHVRNRLYNFKRDNYQRPDKPCITCPLFDQHCANPAMDCTKYTNKQECSVYRSWYKRNNTKKNLMYLNTIEDLKEHLPNQANNRENAANKEIMSLLEEKLQGEHRTVYLKLKYGNKVYKNETNKLLKRIQEILDE